MGKSAISRDAAAILKWYDANRRVLPWRALPGERSDPYYVWLSEIMLQQTTVAAVGAYFRRFIARWPRIEDLANAPPDEVLAAWAGLGYYARARNLHACARMVAQDLGGRFPDNEPALQKLPGIGPYTAAAIAAIAFDRASVPLDGNIERVTARRFAISNPLPAAKAEIRRAAQNFASNSRPGDLAQGLMDLGATVCTPRTPACNRCPLARVCEGRKLGIAETLPAKAAKSVRPTRYGIAYLAVRRDGAVLLRRRPDRGLLGGMWEVPSGDWAADPPPRRRGDAPVPGRWRAVAGRVEHVFTHFRLLLSLYRADGIDDAPLMNPADRWVAPDRLGELALPSLMNKVLELGGIKPSRP